MRKFIVALIACLSWSAFAAAPKTATLDVRNMTCPVCPITIRKALEKVSGVMDAKVDYKHKTATVEYDPTEVDLSALIRATTNAGFPSTLHKAGQRQ